MSDSNSFLGDKESGNELVSQMPEPDQSVYLKFGNRSYESAFEDRLFIIYKDRGLAVNRRHRDPEILTTIKVLSFEADCRKGSRAVIADLITGEEQQITHVPARVFHYDVFMSIPPFMRLRWDGREHEGVIKRSLSFAVLIKTRNKSDFHTSGNCYCEVPNNLRDLYPDFNLQLRYA